MGFLGLLHRLVRRSSEESSNVLGCFGEEGSLVRRTPCFVILELSHVCQWCPGGECGLVF